MPYKDPDALRSYKSEYMRNYRQNPEYKARRAAYEANRRERKNAALRISRRLTRQERPAPPPVTEPKNTIPWVPQPINVTTAPPVTPTTYLCICNKSFPTREEAHDHEVFHNV